MSVLRELKNFMMRGNVVDMAVGIIIGGAFGKIVSSIVSDIIMPPIGVMLSGVSFVDMKLVIKEASIDAAGKALPEVTINYGGFIQTVIDFMVIATVIFFAVKGLNTLRKKQEEIPATPPPSSKEELLLTEIRDLLKENRNK